MSFDISASRRSALRALALPALAFVVLSASLGASVGLAGPSAVSAHAGAPAPTSSPTSSLAAALDSIQPDNIKADLYFIASDELGGRDTPSEGLKIAARYIRSRLERLGWSPGASDGFFYTYKLERKAIDEKASRVKWTADGRSETLQLGRDYFLPSSFDVVGLSVNAPIVYVGNGTKEDFEVKGLEGKWALCFDDGGEPRDIGRRARRAKCAGLLFGPGPAYAGEPYAQRFAQALERQRQGTVRFPDAPKTKDEIKDAGADGKEAPSKDKDASTGEERREGFATVCLSAESMTRLLAAAKVRGTPALGAEIALEVEEVRALQGEGGLFDVENVCGFWPGSDPVLSKEVIIVSAHYDHVGTRNGVVYNGADDNGSGTCGLMALAEALKVNGPMRRSVMLIWVSGEEKGLWGSKAWSSNPWLPEGCKAIADINIDMIGRNAPDKLLVTPTKKRTKDYNGLVRLAEKLAPEEGIPELGSADEYWSRSDHAMFARLGIPVMFFFSDVHDDYHQPGDDPEKIDYDKIRRVVRLILRILDGMQTDNLELK